MTQETATLAPARKVLVDGRYSAFLLMLITVQLCGPAHAPFAMRCDRKGVSRCRRNCKGLIEFVLWKYTLCKFLRDVVERFKPRLVIRRPR